MSAIIVSLTLWIAAAIAGFLLRGRSRLSQGISTPLQRFGRRFLLAAAILTTVGGLANAAGTVYWFRHPSATNYKGMPGSELGPLGAIGGAAIFFFAGFFWAS